MFDATTILAYKGKNKAVIGGDGQVTFGNTDLKGNETAFIEILNKEKPPRILERLYLNFVC